MDLFDLHCDTAYECAVNGGGADLMQGAFHISLPRGRSLERWRQVFAVFMPDEYRERVRDYVCRQAGLFPDVFRLVTDRSALEQSGGCSALLSVEGGSALAGRLERVEQLYRDGVRLMTLTWNAENELGDGVRAPQGRGLTAFGRDVIREMNRLHMAVDVSHLSDAGFADVAALSDAPFVASHSNARALCGNARNLTDGMIGEIAARGGLIGLNFCRAFLRDDGDARMTDILRHAEYMLALGCEDTLCLGSDFDGTDIPYDMTGVESMPALYEAFLRVNYSETLTRKIFSGNAETFFASYVFGDGKQT